MRSVFIYLMISTLTLSLHAQDEKLPHTAPEKQLAPQHLSPADKTATMKKFLAVGSGLCFMGTYGAFYLKARRAHTPIVHSKLIIDSLGYTGAGFSIASASYFASLLWSKSGIFQDKT